MGAATRSKMSCLPTYTANKAGNSLQSMIVGSLKPCTGCGKDPKDIRMTHGIVERSFIPGRTPPIALAGRGKGGLAL